MDVFDSMEPWRQAEQLAADADSREAVLPKCARCGLSITGSKLVYILAHDEFYCLNCIDSMTEFNEEAGGGGIMGDGIIMFNRKDSRISTLGRTIESMFRLSV